MTRWSFLRWAPGLGLPLGPVAVAQAAVFTGTTAAAQGLGPAEGRSGDGTEGFVIDAVLCLGLPLMLLGGLFFLIRFVVRGARLAANSRTRRSSQESRPTKPGSEK